jgi:5-(carboxyamino)imidazole ribonucleotide synthase
MGVQTPIAPPATIGILGGGQLGRMLGMAARAMGYRVAVLDPDPHCPAAPIADLVVVGGYDDVEAALRLAEVSDVVTYELEHVAAAVVEAVQARVPVRPGRGPLLVTQDRLAERRFVEGAGIAVAPWREVHSVEEARDAAGALGLPLRVKLPTGGYDGRGQIRIADAEELDGAWESLGVEAGAVLLAERELGFVMELSVIVARGGDEVAVFPLGRNVHDAGVLVQTGVTAQVRDQVAADAVSIGTRLAVAMDLQGTLTVELFLMPDDTLVVNEIAPRVHNSGHWTGDATLASQFEQHIRAIAGWPLGDPARHSDAVMTNLIGQAVDRWPALLAEPGVRLYLYGKAETRPGRKMGHCTRLTPRTAG